MFKKDYEKRQQKRKDAAQDETLLTVERLVSKHF
jgi:hypothetical protein